MKIVYSKESLKYLAKIEKNLVEHIKKAINGLTKKPSEGDIRPLEGYSDGRMRLLVGKYRVIFKYDTDDSVEILLIINIGARGDIYK